MAEEVKAPVEEVSAKDGGTASLSHEEYNTWNRYEPTTYHDVLDNMIAIHGEATGCGADEKFCSLLRRSEES